MRALPVLVALIAITGVSDVQARNTEYRLPISDVMQDEELRSRLGNDVAFYFSGQAIPPVSKTFGEFVTNKKSNSVGRPDVVACRRAMQSALLQLHKRAKELGADAVIDIVSYYRKQTTRSATEYVCHAGAVIAGVALKGTFVKLVGGAASSATR